MPDYENLKGWFDAGAYCVGMGSKLMAKDAEDNFDFNKIEELTKSALANIRKIRAK